MTREKLPDRRSSLTIRVPYQSINLLLTVGWNAEDPERRLRGVFCASFSAGSDTQTIVVDACILLSRLYQHGDTPAEVAETLKSDTPSLLGTIARVVANAFAEEPPEAT